MRIKVAVLAFALLAPTLARAQGFIRYYPPGGAGGVGGVPTFPLEATTGGNCTTPDYSFADIPDAGLCSPGAEAVSIQTAAAGNSRSELLLTGTDLQGRFYDAAAFDSGFIAGNSFFSIQAGGVDRFSVTPTYVEFGNFSADDELRITPVVAGAGSFIGSFTSADLTAARTWTFPDVSGTPQLNLVAGTAAPGATECDAANEVGRLYHQTGDPTTVNLQLFRCTQTGPASWAWHPAGHHSATTCPATCTQATSPLCYDTDDDILKACSADNTYTAVGGGLADPGSNGMLARTAVNTTAARTITADPGVTCANCSGVAGNPTVGVDRAVVPFKGSGAADPSASCGDTGDPFQLNDTYIETDTSEVYLCIAIDTWALIGHIADDKVIVGTGTSGVVETIPDCDDSGGNHLNYNTTGSAGSRFSCGTSGDGGAGYTFDSTVLHIQDEFLGGADGTANTIGNLGWGRADQGTGGTSLVPNYHFAGHPGIYQFGSDGSADNGGRFIYLAHNYLNIDTINEDFDMHFIFAPASAVTNMFISAGIYNPAGTEFGSDRAIRLIYDTDRSHANYIYQVCDSQTSGCDSAGDDTNANTVDSGVAPSDSGWTVFTIKRRASGVGGNPTIYMSITGGTEKTFCTSGCDDNLANPPGDTMAIRAFAATRNATDARSIFIDFFDWHVTGLGR